jgi:hypothetical protein
MRAEKRRPARRMLAQIVRMVVGGAAVARADPGVSPTIVAGWFVPGVILVAVAHVRGLERGSDPAPASRVRPRRMRSAVLIIACPCALGLATPMSITVGVGPGRAGGRAGQERGGAGTAWRSMDTLVVDKTGTLTAGKPKPGLRSCRPRRRRGAPRCCGWPRAWSVRQRAPARGRRSSRAAEERKLAISPSRDGLSVRRPARAWWARVGGQGPWLLGNAQVS